LMAPNLHLQFVSRIATQNFPTNKPQSTYLTIIQKFKLCVSHT
jgi:hypothetical protein